MITLTPKQRELLDWIEAYTATNNGIAPSYEEMRVAVGLASRSGIHRLVVGLEERGFLRRWPNRPRAIEVVRDPQNSLAGFSIYELTAEIERRKAA